MRAPALATALALSAFIALGSTAATQENDARGATASAAASASPLFSSQDMLEITLRADLRTLFRDRDSTRRVEHDATVTMANASGERVTVPLTLRTRGHYRRQSSVCTTPPIRMRFRGRAARNTAFDGQRNLKLVVQCRGRGEYEQYLLREYLVYRTFQLLSDHSFNARLLRLTWEDAGGRQAPETQYAFVIESEEELQKRLGMHPITTRGARDADLDPEHTALLDLFQYFIGNTDWSIGGLHNIHLLWYRDARPAVAIPYDFDWSGVVEASYARPDSRLPISNVRSRLYRGACRNVDDVDPVIRRFEERRPQIEELWRTAEGLDDRSRRRALDYFAEFYRVTSNRNALRRELSVDCRKP